jgi:plasmid maintenance system antidote protein VapI
MTHPIEDFLDEHGMTATEFAKSVGVTKSMIYQITKGRRPMPAGLAAEIERVHRIPAEVFCPDVFKGLTAKP